MDNNALLAALGMDAVTAVRGYRAAVMSEAARRGLLLTGASFSSRVRARDIDPLDIRLTVRDADRADLVGDVLGWSAASGWWLRRPRARSRARFFAGPDASPLHLVPTPPEVVDWTTTGFTGSADPPRGIDLEDDPTALHRLIAFMDDHRRLHAARAIRTPPRGPVSQLGPRRP